MNDKRKIFTNSLIVIISTFLDKGLFFIINIIVARYLDIDGFGEYTTALAYATFFSTFADIGINQALKRAINLEPADEYEHITNTILIKTILCITVYGILCISLYFTNYNIETIILTLLFGIVRIGNTYMSLFYAIYDAKEKFFTESVIKNSFSITFLLITIGITLLNKNYFYFAYSRLLIVVFFIIILIFIIKKDVNFNYNINLLKSFLREAFFFGLSNIIRNSYLRINILILSFIQGTIYTGIFQNGFFFFTTLSFIPFNFGNVILPNLYRSEYKSNKNKYQFTFDAITKILAIISMLIALNYFVFSERIILIVYGDKYISSSQILKIIAIAVPFMFNISGILITSLDMQRTRTIFQAIALGINVASNIILIYFYKAKGAAISVVITYAFLFVIYNIFLNIKIGIKLKKIIIVYFKLVLTTGILYLIFIFWLSEISLYYSIVILNIAYLGIVSAIMIRSDEIRIVKEIIGQKS